MAELRKLKRQLVKEILSKGKNIKYKGEIEPNEETLSIYKDFKLSGDEIDIIYHLFHVRVGKDRLPFICRQRIRPSREEQIKIANNRYSKTYYEKHKDMIKEKRGQKRM